jgi:hypothetical protein
MVVYRIEFTNYNIYCPQKGKEARLLTVSLVYDDVTNQNLDKYQIICAFWLEGKKHSNVTNSTAHIQSGKTICRGKRYKTTQQDILFYSQKLDSKREVSSPTFESWNRSMLLCSWYSRRKNNSLLRFTCSNF